LVWSDNVDKVFVRDEHPATAVSLDAKLVEDHLRVLGLFGLAGAGLELFPVLADDVTARETPDRYHHT
jgi:hypothetical protein